MMVVDEKRNAVTWPHAVEARQDVLQINNIFTAVSYVHIAQNLRSTGILMGVPELSKTRVRARRVGLEEKGKVWGNQAKTVWGECL
jgi:hypothetical protein